MTKTTVHVFIDTNTFLSFFAFTKDDVEELSKLVSLIRTKLVKLYLTDQVRDEFYRNREKKLRDSIAQFEKVLAPPGIPRFMADYPQIADYSKLLNDYLKAKNEAIQRAKKEAIENRLGADVLFKELTLAAKIKRMTESDYSSAIKRMRRRNPPGKEGSLGDQINWEILLRVVPDNTDLHLVSRDGDFASPLSQNAPDAFLISEWKKKKHGKLLLHSELKPFLAEHFPEIKLAIDVERRAAIERLKNSGSFAQTHTSIAELEPFAGSFTGDEIDELLHAARSNGQIGRISNDEDVRGFYEPLIELQHDDRRLSAAEYRKWLDFFGVDKPDK